MGPTNVALVQLMQADQQLRQAQQRLETTTHNVRIQERRVRDLDEKLRLTQTQLKEIQARAGAQEAELKSHDAHIERLRTQQQSAKTNKEYQTFLLEINTHKADRGKLEDETMKLLESAEKLAGQIKEMEAQLAGEKSRLEQMRAEIGDKTAALTAEIESLKPLRQQAAGAVPSKALETFERLAERYEGEALAAISKPNKRREEYVCTSCNMELTTDVYNKLHNRDEMVLCTSCRRLLYIPEDLTPDQAIHKKKPAREKAEASDEPKPAKKERKSSRGRGAWSEKEFFDYLAQQDRSRIQQVQQGLLERLRSGGVEGVEILFDDREGDIPAYHIYIRGCTAPLLRVQADGAYRANWKSLESRSMGLMSLAQAQFREFLQDADSASGHSAAAEGKTLPDIDPDQLAGAIFEVAARAVQGASTQNPLSV